MIADNYKSSMEKYRVNGSGDEWFIAKLTDSLLKDCSSSIAFDAIEPIVDVAISEVEGNLFYDHVQFLIKLARKANTSESPEVLKNSIESLHEKAINFGNPQLEAMKELCLLLLTILLKVSIIPGSNVLYLQLNRKIRLRF